MMFAMNSERDLHTARRLARRLRWGVALGMVALYLLGVIAGAW